MTSTCPIQDINFDHLVKVVSIGLLLCNVSTFLFILLGILLRDT